MLVSKTIKVKLNSGQQVNYYKQKHYEKCFLHKEIEVKIKDLPENSHLKVLVQCDYCGKIYEKSYAKYNANKKNEYVKKDCCKDCIYIKEKEILQEKYKCDYTFQIQSVREKIKETCLKKYGVDNPGKIPGIREKAKKTNLRKYGVENVLNTKSPFYEECRIKLAEANAKGNKVHNSIPQQYLINLYNCECNFPIKYYNVDGCFLKENIYLEYDGSGHKLSVLKGFMTEEDFNKKELKRYWVIKKEGYKNFRIINENNRDVLPRKEILLQIKDIAFQVLLSTDNQYIHFNMDENIVHTKTNDIKWDYKDLLSEDKIKELLK